MTYVVVVLWVVLASLAVAMLAAFADWFRTRGARAERRAPTLELVDQSGPDAVITTFGRQRMLRDRSGSGALWGAGSEWDRHFGVHDPEGHK